MRKASKIENERVQGARIQGYHEGASWGSESYAFVGFESNKYFTSDRFEVLDENFNRKNGKPLKGFGLEIETVNNAICDSDVYANVLSKMVLSQLPKGLFKMQRDGSLGGDSSAECITQIMTKEFIRNHYADFKTMWNELFPMIGTTTDDRSCGMHCNVSLGCFGASETSQEEAVRKLYYMINKHFDLFKVALYRNGSTSYCEKMNYSIAKTMDIHSFSSNHYVCFNLGHYNAGRIEIRLVGGQKNFACFRNTMEVIFHVIEASKKLDWKDLDDVTKIFNGCNKYVFDRLSTNVRRSGYITAEQIEKIRTTVDTETQYI